VFAGSTARPTRTSAPVWADAGRAIAAITKRAKKPTDTTLFFTIFCRMVELTPVKTPLLAPPVYPLKGESLRIVVETLKSLYITAYTVVLIMSKQFLG
jgi:hypothetical protein